MRALAGRVAVAWGSPVVAGFLDFDQPTVADALTEVSGGPAPVVVPGLLTHAYHSRVDLPAVLARAPVAARLAPVLGPDPLLLAALRRRLSELDTSGDGLVLIAAGTSDAAARSTVDAMAADLGRRCGLPCAAGYASASGPTVPEAVAAVRARGARRILGASYFLAPGRLFDAATAAAMAAGAAGVAAPLGDAPELVRLVIARAAQAVRVPSLGGLTPEPVA